MLTQEKITFWYKIVRLINSSALGLNAHLITDSSSKNAIQISSKATGLGENETSIFAISSTISWRELNTLGISRVTQAASNSSFKLNDVEHQSMSNTFTVNKSFEINLKSPSKAPVSVGLMNDTEALTDGVNQLLNSYNGMIDIGLKYTSSQRNRTLFNEISAIAKGMSACLADVGITADGMGHLTLDAQRLSDIINSENKVAAFATLNELKIAISNAASKASINPMAYVDKAVVEYKNPGKTLAAPYATSAYSGMMMNYGL